MAMIVERSMSDGLLTNTYLVAAGPNSDAFLVDAGGPLDPLFAKADEHGLNVTHILLTHHHYDHVVDLDQAREQWPDAKVLANPAEEIADTEALNPGDEVTIGGLTVTAIHTPGHTAGMLNLLVNGEELFTGDTLFKGSVGGVRAPGSTSFEDIKHSIMEVILTCPGETVIRPGHTDPSTVADELENNPFVRIWRGVDPEGTSSARPSATRPRWCSGAPTTTAATRRGCAGRTAPTTSSRARRWSANVEGVPP